MNGITGIVGNNTWNDVLYEYLHNGICAEKGENERVVNLRTSRCESATDTDVGKGVIFSIEIMSNLWRF